MSGRRVRRWAITYAEPPLVLRGNLAPVPDTGTGERDQAEAAPASAWAPVHRVSFVLPAFNEEANITRAIDTTVAAATRYCSVYEVLVVDDGSSDATAQLVERALRDNSAVRLLRHGTNRGYGEALRTGFEHAALDFVFFTDADNQFDMDELPLLLAWADDADCVAGYRKQRHDPLVRRLNAWAWNRLVRVLFCVPVRDVDCAFKLFRRDALAAITIESGGAMINTEIMVKLSRAGRNTVEIGVSHRPRVAGAAHGANLQVILRAFREVTHMYPQLADLGPTTSPTRAMPAVPEAASGA